MSVCKGGAVWGWRRGILRRRSRCGVRLSVARWGRRNARCCTRQRECKGVLCIPYHSFPPPCHSISIFICGPVLRLFAWPRREPNTLLPIRMVSPPGASCCPRRCECSWMDAQGEHLAQMSTELQAHCRQLLAERLGCTAAICTLTRGPALLQEYRVPQPVHRLQRDVQQSSAAKWRSTKLSTVSRPHLPVSV